MTPLPYLAVFKLAGADAGKFLQAQVTAQLAGLNKPFASFAAYCSPKGQVIATLLLAPREDHWLVVVEASLVATLQTRLQKFIMRDDVQIEPLNGLYLFAVDSTDSLADGVILLEPAAVAVQYAISTTELPANPQATDRWRRSELLLGIPWLNLASSEKYIPQMLGLDSIGAVSFSKGCYPGQEVIARARHLGQVKRRPHILDLGGPLAPDVDSPCLIQTIRDQTEATIVHCVHAADQAFTVFTVAALKPGDEIRGLEQNGQFWSAKEAVQETWA